MPRFASKPNVADPNFRLCTLSLHQNSKNEWNCSLDIASYRQIATTPKLLKTTPKFVTTPKRPASAAICGAWFCDPGADPKRKLGLRHRSIPSRRSQASLVRDKLFFFPQATRFRVRVLTAGKQRVGAGQALDSVNYALRITLEGVVLRCIY